MKSAKLLHEQYCLRPRINRDIHKVPSECLIAVGLIFENKRISCRYMSTKLRALTIMPRWKIQCGSCRPVLGDSPCLLFRVNGRDTTRVVKPIRLLVALCPCDHFASRPPY